MKQKSFPSINDLRDHVRNLLSCTRMLICNTARTKSEILGLDDIDFSKHAAMAWNSLRNELQNKKPINSWKSELTLIRSDVFIIGPVCENSAHEAVIEFSRQVSLAFGQAVSTNFSKDRFNEIVFWKHEYIIQKDDAAIRLPGITGEEVFSSFNACRERLKAYFPYFYPDIQPDIAPALRREIAQLQLSVKSKRVVKTSDNTGAVPDAKSGLYEAIRAMRMDGKTARAIVAYIESPAGKDLKEMVDADLKNHPKTRQHPFRKRTIEDVVRAALKATYPNNKSKQAK